LAPVCTLAGGHLPLYLRRVDGNVVGKGFAKVGAGVCVGASVHVCCCRHSFKWWRKWGNRLSSKGVCVYVCVCVCGGGGAGKWRCRFQGVRSLGKGLWWLLCVKSSSEKKKRRTKKKRHAIASSNKNCSPVVRSRAAGAPTVASLKKVLGIGQLLRAGRR